MAVITRQWYNFWSLLMITIQPIQTQTLRLTLWVVQTVGEGQWEMRFGWWLPAPRERTVWFHSQPDTIHSFPNLTRIPLSDNALASDRYLFLRQQWTKRWLPPLLRFDRAVRFQTGWYWEGVPEVAGGDVTSCRRIRSFGVVVSNDNASFNAIQDHHASGCQPVISVGSPVLFLTVVCQELLFSVRSCLNLTM